MNLLMISGDRSIPQGKKGAFWYTLEELRKHWERIDVVCPVAQNNFQFSIFPFEGLSPPGPNGNFQLFDNVFLHPSPHSLWYQPFWVLQKGKELSRQHHYKVMTVHDYPPFYNGCGAWMLHRATGMPWVSEIHHVVGYPVAADFRERIGRRMYPLYLRTFAQKAAAFRVVNAAVRDYLIQWGVPKEKVHIVSSFYLDHELLRTDPSVEKKYDVVFCGRLVANKGMEELLAAVATIPESSLRVLVIGDGPLHGKLKAESCNLKARVTFAGWLPSQQEVYRAVQSAKIFVMCSKSEGGPRVLLEAMALGLPVIATNVGVVPEVIRDGENGLITTGTPDDLAQKIQTLLSNDALRVRLGAEAKKVLQLFERKKLIGEYAEFLQSMKIA